MRPRPAAAPTYRYIGSTAKTRDGWDSLGDLGWFDDDGYLYLADRRVDMFTVRWPQTCTGGDRERLSAHPAVLSSWWSGPHEDLGQVPHALVHHDGNSTSPPCRASWPAARGLQGAAQCGVRRVPLRDDAGKARRTAVRDEVIARRQAQARP